MSLKQNKQQSNKQNSLDYFKRPVTKLDKWCKMLQPKAELLNSEAPYGYIIAIPIQKQDMLLKDIRGYIVRSKRKGKILFLQVITREFIREQRQYGATFKQREISKKRQRYIINIRNLNKSYNKL